MERPKHYYQGPIYTCGPANLVIAYRAHGVKTNETNIAIECGTTKEGTDWAQMFYHAAAVMGFPTELKSGANYKDLQSDFVKGIIIVAWSTDADEENNPHYATLSEIEDDLIELIDSGQPLEDNPLIMTKEEFVNKWFITGYNRSYLLIKPKSS